MKLRQLAIIVFTVIAIILMSISGVASAASTARMTVPAGTVCMVNAPSGVVPGGLIGHVGWAYQSGSGDQWTFGATEGVPEKIKIAPDNDTHSWSSSGTWLDLVKTFTNAHLRGQELLYPANYYTQFRCRSVNNGNESAVLAQVQKQASNGYDGLANNCLTKTVAIFQAYGVTDLPRATDVTPNEYFNFQLTGFEEPKPLETSPRPLGLLDILGDSG